MTLTAVMVQAQLQYAVVIRRHEDDFMIQAEENYYEEKSCQSRRISP
jgi:hypothetical protein